MVIDVLTVVVDLGVSTFSPALEGGSILNSLFVDTVSLLDDFLRDLPDRIQTVNRGAFKVGTLALSSTSYVNNIVPDVGNLITPGMDIGVRIAGDFILPGFGPVHVEGGGIGDSTLTSRPPRP